MKPELKMPTNLRFGMSADVREWERQQALKERSDALYNEGLILIEQSSVDDIAVDIADMSDAGLGGWLCDIDDLHLAMDDADPNTAKLGRCIEDLQAKLAKLRGQLETMLGI